MAKCTAINLSHFVAPQLQAVPDFSLSKMFRFLPDNPILDINPGRGDFKQNLAFTYDRIKNV